MTTVWRVENENRKGPYRIEWRNLIRKMAMCAAHASDGSQGDTHPVWSNDGLWADEVTDQHVAAFRSRKQLDTWFDGWFDDLAREGFHVVSYEVPEYLVVDGRSHRQCAAYQPEFTNRKVHSWDSREQLALF